MEEKIPRENTEARPEAPRVGVKKGVQKSHNTLSGTLRSSAMRRNVWPLHSQHRLEQEFKGAGKEGSDPIMKNIKKMAVLVAVMVVAVMASSCNDGPTAAAKAAAAAAEASAQRAEASFQSQAVLARDQVKLATAQAAANETFLTQMGQIADETTASMKSAIQVGFIVGGLLILLGIVSPVAWLLTRVKRSLRREIPVVTEDAGAEDVVAEKAATEEAPAEEAAETKVSKAA